MNKAIEVLKKAFSIIKGKTNNQLHQLHARACLLLHFFQPELLFSGNNETNVLHLQEIFNTPQNYTHCILLQASHLNEIDRQRIVQNSGAQGRTKQHLKRTRGLAIQIMAQGWEIKAE